MDKLLFKELGLLLVTWLIQDSAWASKLAPWALTVEPPPMINDNFNPTCFNFTHGNYHEMEFYSPLYPDLYPSEADCSMYIQAPKGFTIDLHFMERFHVEESEGCAFDYIELRDGPFGYSKLIARFCGEGFPVSISTKSRFLWARFATDDVIQFGGFAADYEFKSADEDDGGESVDVCRIYMDNMAQDGELNSKVFPLADTSHRDYPIDKPVDCTWEMLVDRESRIMLSDMKLRVTREGNCQNMIEIYDSTSSPRNKTAVYCGGPVHNYQSLSNRIYLRVYGNRLSNKPVLFARYTVYRPTNEAGGCGEREFYCDDMCLSKALVCNGHVNCPSSKADEQGCPGSEAESSSGGLSAIPMMTIIIICAVAGLLVTGLIIGMCITCAYKSKQREKRKQSSSHNDSQKRNALEMAVSDSSNTAFQLAKQNNQSSYYSLPRPSGHATMMQHRGSFSKVPSEGDYSDQMTDSNAYKKFLQLEQSYEDDSSRCPSPYSPGFTTIAEHHPLPPGMTVTPDLGWGYPSQTDANAPPTLAENLSKLQQYNQFVNSMPKTIPTTTEDPNSPGMTMDFRYDPSIPVYPATKFRIKSPEIKYGWGTQQDQPTSPGGKSVTSLTFKNQDAETAPDLTREIGTT